MTFEQAVSGKRPLLRLVIRGAEGRQVTIDALVDTGFDGSLALPESLIATLALPERRTLSPVRYRLADESIVIPQSFTARILWEGIERPVRVLQLGSHPLVGMGFLYGYRVCVEALDGGDIEVTLIEN